MTQLNTKEAERKAKKAEYNRKYCKVNHEQIAATSKKWREANPKKLAATRKKWRAANPEKEAAYQKKWRKANPEKLAAIQKDYNSANREKVAAAQKEYNSANRENIAAYKKKWFEANREKLSSRQKKYNSSHPEILRACQLRRRARQRGAAGWGYTTEVHISARWEAFGGLCWMCGGQATAMDHVKPISKGGAHWPSNLRPACKSCNSTKRAKWPFPTTTNKETT
mgnify:CR=1 FL=1|tara:strand:+ start:555 stop:1229 length:675 start_codon:yes stop_codon:yes gene_type:complete